MIFYLYGGFGMRPNKHRLAMDIPEPVWKELKRMSEKYNINITQYMLRMIIENLQKEQQYD